MMTESTTDQTQNPPHLLIGIADNLAIACDGTGEARIVLASVCVKVVLWVVTHGSVFLTTAFVFTCHTPIHVATPPFL